MNYAYFPGCSAKGSGRSYEESLLAVFGALGSGLDEIKDWNCCGAAAYPSVDMAKALAFIRPQSHPGRGPPARRGAG